MGRVEYAHTVFEWDDDKNISNKKKHGLFFETAIAAFFDEHSLTETDFIQNNEQRWKTIGMAPDSIMILFIGHVIFDDEIGREVIRVITARKATLNEERTYYVSY